MAYDAKVVANYFLDLAERDHVFVSPLKLQKLVYLAHGWSLALRATALLKQSVEAWRYGPVIPSLYREFKEFGGSAISRKARVSEGQELDADTKKLIEAVWERYKSLSGTQLSALTHEPGSAWDLTRRELFHALIPSTSVIPDDLIADEFQRRKTQA